MLFEWWQRKLIQRVICCVFIYNLIIDSLCDAWVRVVMCESSSFSCQESFVSACEDKCVKYIRFMYV